MRDATNIGGAGRAFPPTRWTMIRNAADPASPEHRTALNELCSLYWKPAYAFVRAFRGAGNEDAKDLTQEFLARIIDGRLLSRYAPDRGSFRAYLRGALRLFLLEQHREASTERRGGGRVVVPLPDAELPAAGSETPEEQFDRQWADALLDHAAGELRRELATSGREPWFRVFESYDLEGEERTYAQLALELGIRPSDVSNRLMFCRRRMRELIADRIRDYVDSEAELAAEIGDLFKS
jgi:RNA polymerase sigma-70 factor (ECF subfamily)